MVVHNIDISNQDASQSFSFLLGAAVPLSLKWRWLYIIATIYVSSLSSCRSIWDDSVVKPTPFIVFRRRRMSRSIVTRFTTLGGRLVFFYHRRAKDSSRRDVSDRCSCASTWNLARGRRTVEYARALANWRGKVEECVVSRQTGHVGQTLIFGVKVTN